MDPALPHRLSVQIGECVFDPSAFPRERLTGIIGIHLQSASIGRAWASAM
jgi:hypothetical protein